MRHRCLCLLLVMLCMLPVPAALSENTPEYAHYTDIPGVTQEDIDRIEALRQQRPEGLVYGMLYSDEAFYATPGETGGFARLVCDWLSDLLDIPVTLEILAWDDLIEGLESQAVDLSGELAITPERQEVFHMTGPIAERSYAVFHLADRGDLDIFNSESSYRYGFLEGSITYEGVLNTSEASFTATFVHSFQEAAQALREGRIDAFLCETMEGAAFGNDADIVYQDYYPIVLASVSLATANLDVYAVIDVVQHYLDAAGMGHFYDMYRDGEREYRRHVFREVLTDEEKAFLDAHTQSGEAIAVAAEFDNYPNSFYNQQEKAWQGIAHDLFREFEYLTGLVFETVTAPDEAWSSIITKLEAGEVDMITGLVQSKDRQGRFLWPKTPYVVDRHALLSLAETADMTVSQVLHARVGLVEGTAYAEAFHRLYPQHTNTVVYADTVSCFDALEAGEIDLAMLPRNLLLSVTNYMERPGFKINVSFDIPCESYFGFHADQAVLSDIVGKAQGILDVEAIADRWTRRVFDYNKKLVQARVPYLIGMSALLLAVLVLVVVLYRKRERVSRMLGMTDSLTQLPNRRSYDDRLRSLWQAALKQRLSLSLLTIDVDHFKQYNDAFGHPQGDVLLQQAAQVFRSALKRPGDFAARIGGEEFAILLPNTDAQGARVVAEKIRRQLEQEAFETLVDGQPAHVTVSIGLASMKPRPTDSVQTLVERSDQALYQAKETGRNRVCAL